LDDFAVGCAFAGQSRGRHCTSFDSADATDAGSVRERPWSVHDVDSRAARHSVNDPATPSALKTDPPVKIPGEAVRGDPDGCGLDPVTTFCSPLPDRRSTLTLPTLIDDLSNSKKGWLLRLSYRCTPHPTYNPWRS